MNELLTQIFANPKSIIIAFDLESYRTKFNEQYPNLTFINQAEKFIDVREYYSKVYDDKDNLQAIVRNLFEKAICKAESNCNWNKRPLKKTQIHHAALDAYILIDIVKTLKDGKGRGKLDKNVKKLDKQAAPPPPQGEKKLFTPHPPKAPHPLDILNSDTCKTEKFKTQIGPYGEEIGQEVKLESTMGGCPPTPEIPLEQASLTYLNYNKEEKEKMEPPSEKTLELTDDFTLSLRTNEDTGEPIPDPETVAEAFVALIQHSLDTMGTNLYQANEMLKSIVSLTEHNKENEKRLIEVINSDHLVDMLQEKANTLTV